MSAFTAYLLRLAAECLTVGGCLLVLGRRRRTARKAGRAKYPDCLCSYCNPPASAGVTVTLGVFTAGPDGDPVKAVHASRGDGITSLTALTGVNLTPPAVPFSHQFPVGSYLASPYGGYFRAMSAGMPVPYGVVMPADIARLISKGDLSAMSFAARPKCPSAGGSGCTCTGSCLIQCACAWCMNHAWATPPPSARRSRAGHAGVPGFDGKARGEFEFAAGSVLGLRQWDYPVSAQLHKVINNDGLPAMGLLCPNPADAPLLRGQTGRQSWTPGVMEAKCNNHSDHKPPVEWDPVRGQECGCVSPGTRVLTADLRWVPAGDLTIGERLLAFDEYPEDRGFGRAGGRKYRDAVVASTERGPLPCYDLRFSDGTAVRVSADHRWLCYSGQKAAHWVRTDELRAGGIRASHVVKPFTPWEAGVSRGAGYLAAAFDGEGYVHQRPGTPQYSSRIGYAQVSNEMLAEVEHLLKALGFSYQHRVSPASPGQPLRADGTPRLDKHELHDRPATDLVRFLGEVRPVRLLTRFQPGLLGRLNMTGHVQLIEKTYAGEQEVVKLGTTAGTYFAEGLASHNCGFWAYWKLGAHTWNATLPVHGVVEGTGRVLIGEKGFRCQRARIIALTPGFLVDPVYHGSGTSAPEAEMAEKTSKADAWNAVIMEELGSLYPDARVFATMRAMIALFPPGEK